MPLGVSLSPFTEEISQSPWDVAHTEGLYETPACFAKPLGLSYIHTLILIFFFLFSFEKPL